VTATIHVMEPSKGVQILNHEHTEQENYNA